jgi:O-antigen ligase
MIRLSLLGLYIAFFAVYAWKDWFKSLCALILLIAVIEHPDMPKSMFGIQGLSPWNLLLVVIMAAWLRARKREGLVWDLPKGIGRWMLLYFGVILVGWVRMVADPTHLEDGVASLLSEHLINNVKWVLPALMLFDGARDRKRFQLGLISVLGVYFLLAVQVIKWMPLASAVSGNSLSERSLKILVNEIGFHRVNMSAMLAAASWAIFAARPLARTSRQEFLVLGAAAITVFGQALTAGRAGYVTWAAVGGILCLIRWRKYLLAAPVLVLAIVTLAPGVTERMLEGFRSAASHQFFAPPAAGTDVYAVTAGRNVAWPLVIDKIKQNPIIGYGRQAMIRTGITAYLAGFAEGFSHPHNAYLETLLDNGIIGFVIIVPFYLLMLLKSVSLFRDSSRLEYVAIGGVGSAFLFALLIASMGSQSFYPREGWAAMWGAIFLMLRVDVLRARERSAARVAQPVPTGDLFGGPSAEPSTAGAPVTTPPRRPAYGVGQIADTFAPRVGAAR